MMKQIRAHVGMGSPILLLIMYQYPCCSPHPILHQKGHYTVFIYPSIHKAQALEGKQIKVSKHPKPTVSM